MIKGMMGASFLWVCDVKVLGLIGSARKLGNCELLVKEALMSARDKGAEVRAVRLTDYRLLPCKGCMACVFRGEPCRLDDDMHQLWEQLQWADGLILSAPTYFLGTSGIIKLLIDRLFEYSLALGQARRRPAALIATAGLPHWDPFTMPLLTMLAGVLQLDVVDKMVAYRPGPGEVLLDEDTMKKAAELGRRVAEATSKPEFHRWSPQQGEQVCPQCGTPFIQLVEEDRVECPLCQLRGRLSLVGGKASVTWDAAGGKNRWSPEALAEHFSQWVIRTGPVYQKLRSQIQERLGRYREFPIEPGPSRGTKRL